VHAAGITQGGTSFSPDYFTIHRGNESFVDYPYMSVDFRTTNTGEGDLFFLSTTGSGFWSGPSTYVIIANVRKLRLNGAPNFDYYLTGPTFTVSAELHFDNEDTINACF